MSSKSVSFNKNIVVCGKTVNVKSELASGSTSWTTVDVEDSGDTYVYSFSAERNPRLHGRNESVTINFNTEYEGKELFNNPVQYKFTSTQSDVNPMQVIMASNDKLNESYSGISYYALDGNNFTFNLTSENGGKYEFSQSIVPNQTITLSGMDYNCSVEIESANTETDHVYTMTYDNSSVKFEKNPSINFSLDDIKDEFMFSTKTYDVKDEGVFNLNGYVFNLTQPYVSYMYTYNGLNGYYYLRGLDNQEPLDENTLRLPSYVRSLELVSYSKDGDSVNYEFLKPGEFDENININFDSSTNALDLEYSSDKNTPIKDCYFVVNCHLGNDEHQNKCMVKQNVDFDTYVISQNTKEGSEYRNLVTYNADKFNDEVQNVDQGHARYDNESYEEIVNYTQAVMLYCPEMKAFFESKGIGLDQNLLFKYNTILDNYSITGDTPMDNYKLSRTYIFLGQNGEQVTEYTESNTDELIDKFNNIEKFIMQEGDYGTDDYYIYFSGDLINLSEDPTSYPRSIVVNGKEYSIKSDDNTFYPGVIIFYELSYINENTGVDKINYLPTNIDAFNDFEMEEGYLVNIDGTETTETNKIRFLKVFTQF